VDAHVEIVASDFALLIPSYRLLSYPT
jgi:hypothetical protein